MEEERGGGAVDVKLMSLDSSDAAQQHWSSECVCVGGGGSVCVCVSDCVHLCAATGQQGLRPHHRHYITARAALTDVMEKRTLTFSVLLPQGIILSFLLWSNPNKGRS